MVAEEDGIDVFSQTRQNTCQVKIDTGGSCAISSFRNNGLIEKAFEFRELKYENPNTFLWSGSKSWSIQTSA